MSTMTSTETVWVVVDGQHRVVLLCRGEDAAEAAAEWRDRGYGVEQLGEPDVSAA